MAAPLQHQSSVEDDDYFNDLTQQPGNEASESQIPKAKRIACVLCRKRKLRCDGAKPSCGTCARLSHVCEYSEERKKSGPRRGYVKQLEARLAQVETLLKTQDVVPASDQSPDAHTSVSPPAARDGINAGGSPPSGLESHPSQPNPAFFQRRANPSELTSMGLEEAMPTREVQDELNRIYFEKIHPIMPMIHPGRFYAALRMPPQNRPPTCLLYAMWANVASVVDKYEELMEHFYHRSRKYIERDEMRGHGESIITLQHVQSWILISTLEFKMTYFPRAWMSTGRASRLSSMMGLHRVDHSGVDVKQCLPPPRDWTDKEERRRVFWVAFNGDRFASIGTGWPMVIDEMDIRTNLPSDDASFENQIQRPSVSLNQVMEGGDLSTLSSLGGVCVTTSLFGRNLLHLHRGTSHDDESNLNGRFWQRHRTLDNILLQFSLAMPDRIRLPAGISDPNTIFTNLCVHTATICLHQAAIFKADTHKLPVQVSGESKIRCITAAAEIASIMRTISHIDLTTVHPFSAFCLYVAARVFVQYLKSRPTDSNVKTSLHFLLTAMQALKRKNLLTESLFTQLDIDLLSAGLEESRSLRNRLASMAAFKNKHERMQCASDRSADPDEIPFMGNPPSFNGDGGPGNNRSSMSASAQYRNGRVQSLSDSGQSPTSVANGEGADFSRVRFMPTRTKIPSTRPSPATVSDEMMDTSMDAFTDSASPGSLRAASSHTSTTQETPPMFQHDSQSSIGGGSDQVNNSKHTTPGTTVMSNEEFQLMMDQYTQSVNTNDLADDPLNVMMGSGADDMSFVMPNLPYGAGVDGEMHTGFTPGPTSDLLNMTDDEWRQILDAGLTDGGWDTGVPKKPHYAHA